MRGCGTNKPATTTAWWSVLISLKPCSAVICVISEFVWLWSAFPPTHLATGNCSPPPWEFFEDMISITHVSLMKIFLSTKMQCPHNSQKFHPLKFPAVRYMTPGDGGRNRGERCVGIMFIVIYLCIVDMWSSALILKYAVLPMCVMCA